MPLAEPVTIALFIAPAVPRQSARDGSRARL
jgi:hypothetical protein